MKRDKGIRKASGEVLALADSDIVMDPDWLSRAIPRLLAQGGGVVAGGMKRIHDTFWGRFVDRNVLAAKTPRVRRSYSVTARNFGHHRTRPPITANAVFTRDVYESCPLDVAWAYGYEDYEWFWRVAKARHKLWFAGDISGAHHHRRRFRDLITEYRRSAEGCSHFIRRHPDSPLAVKRRRQAISPANRRCCRRCRWRALAADGMCEAMTAAAVIIVLVLMGREIIAARQARSSHVPICWRSPRRGLHIDSGHQPRQEKHRASYGARLGRRSTKRPPVLASAAQREANLLAPHRCPGPTGCILAELGVVQYGVR